MILALYAAGGFLVGILTTVLVIMVKERKAEHAAFLAFWG